MKRSVEEYIAEAMLLGLYYFGAIHMYLGMDWPAKAMHPDTHETIEDASGSEHHSFYYDNNPWPDITIDQWNDGWHRYRRSSYLEE